MTSDVKTKESPVTTRPAPEEFRVVSVGRRGLGLLGAVIERFCETGVSQWTSETLMQTAWDRLAVPLFRIWAVVRRGDVEPVGFLAAQVQITESGTELYLLAAYMDPSLPFLQAGKQMLDAALRWGRIMGCESSMVRTVRGTANGLAEPRAWEALGFVYDSTLLRGPMTPRFEAEISEAAEESEE